jgi:hypothetical protein
MAHPRVCSFFLLFTGKQAPAAAAPIEAAEAAQELGRDLER